MPGDHPYLKEGPKCLLISCDVLLGLDDGTKLPVHSHVLARCSSPFANMLDDGPLSSASPANKITVPFEDCSRDEADSFLSAVYSLTPQEHIEEASALSIARLGHKYGLKGFVERCDTVLSEAAGINHDPAEMPSYLKDKAPEVFWHMLECATVYGMPKLLACCEHHLAIDPLQRFKILPASFPSGQYLPGCSLLRVADGLRAAFHSMALEHAIPKLPAEQCDCECCRHVRARTPNMHHMHYPSPAECLCSKTFSSSCQDISLAEHVPGPKEFLRIAKG